MYYPKSPMTDGERKVWFAQWCDDLKHKTDSEIAYACTRYRQNSENRFFPTPGQLIALCQPAFENRPRRYAELEPLPPLRSKEEMEKLFASLREKYPDAFAGRGERFDMSDRGPTPQETGPMTPERKAMLLGSDLMRGFYATKHPREEGE
jgi:hypothetical protein